MDQSIAEVIVDEGEGWVRISVSGQDIKVRMPSEDENRGIDMCLLMSIWGDDGGEDFLYRHTSEWYIAHGPRKNWITVEYTAVRTELLESIHKYLRTQVDRYAEQELLE
jgi:hypothetical protein